jgi:hypothetical protein
MSKNNSRLCLNLTVVQEIIIVAMNRHRRINTHSVIKITIDKVTAAIFVLVFLKSSIV